MNIARGTGATDAVNFQQYNEGLNQTLDSAIDYVDEAIAGVEPNNGSGGSNNTDELNEINRRLGQQSDRINVMGAMSAAGMATAANIGQLKCKKRRDCLGHGSFAVGAGHYENEIAGAVIYSQPLPRGRISLGVSFADNDMATSVGMGFDF